MAPSNFKKIAFGDDLLRFSDLNDALRAVVRKVCYPEGYTFLYIFKEGYYTFLYHKKQAVSILTILLICNIIPTCGGHKLEASRGLAMPHEITAPQVISFSPQVIFNKERVFVDVRGAGFEKGSRLVINGFVVGNKYIRVVDPHFLIVKVPRGVPPGKYLVVVRTPDGKTSNEVWFEVRSDTHTASLRVLAFAERARNKKQSFYELFRYMVAELFDVRGDIASTEASVLRWRIQDKLRILGVLKNLRNAVHASTAFSKIIYDVYAINESIKSSISAFDGFQDEYPDVITSFKELDEKLLEVIKDVKRRIKAEGHAELKSVNIPRPTEQLLSGI